MARPAYFSLGAEAATASLRCYARALAEYAEDEALVNEETAARTHFLKDGSFQRVSAEDPDSQMVTMITHAPFNEVHVSELLHAFCITFVLSLKNVPNNSSEHVVFCVFGVLNISLF